MSFSLAHVPLVLCAATLAVPACGGALPAPHAEVDASDPADRAKVRSLDAARAERAADQAPDPEPADGAALDGRSWDGGRGDLTRGDPAGDAGGSRCVAGNVCRGASRCQRSCFGDLVSRCSCTEGHFVCTGCMPVDGGAGDARSFESCPGGAGAQGRRCDRGGTICQFRLDAGTQRLCVCGEVGVDRLWVCQ